MSRKSKVIAQGSDAQDRGVASGVSKVASRIGAGNRVMRSGWARADGNAERSEPEEKKKGGVRGGCQSRNKDGKKSNERAEFDLLGETWMHAQSTSQQWKPGARSGPGGHRLTKSCCHQTGWLASVVEPAFFHQVIMCHGQGARARPPLALVPADAPSETDQARGAVGAGRSWSLERWSSGDWWITYRIVFS